MHGPSTAPRGPTAARAGRSSHGELTWRPAPRVGWVATRRSRTGSGGPETPRDTSVVVANGRLVVIFSLVGRLDWNKGQRGPCGVHADDCAASFVSNRSPPSSALVGVSGAPGQNFQPPKKRPIFYQKFHLYNCLFYYI